MTALTSISINNINELTLFEKQWEAFNSKLVVSNLCTSWPWVITWCQLYLQPKDQLSIQLYFDAEQLVAIFPFYIKNNVLKKELRFIATGEAEAIEVCSEFQDIMVLPKYETSALIKLTDFVLKNKAINYLCFDNYLPDSNISLWLSRLNSHQWQKNTVLMGKRYLVDVYANTTEQIANIRSKSIRRHARRSIECVDFSVELVADIKGFNLTFKELIGLHNDAWAFKGKPGVFTQKQFVTFHNTYAESLLNRGKLVLFSLQYKKKTVAVFYGFIEQNILYYYQSGIDKGCTLPFVGVAMHLAALEIARNYNLSHYDLMKGSEYSYKNKYQYGSTEVLSTVVRKFPFSLLFNMKLWFAKLIRPQGTL